jgi:hypothetical protein
MVVESRKEEEALEGGHIIGPTRLLVIAGWCVTSTRPHVIA